MNSQILNFVECCHKISKHVDGQNCDLWWDYSAFRDPVAVVSEGCTKMLQWQNIALN